MATYLRFVTDPAEGHSDKLAIRRPGDTFPQRCLAHTRRTHQAQDRPFHLAYPVLNRQIFDDPVFDFVQTIVVFVENRLRDRQIFADT